MYKNKIKLIIFLPNLHGGGAEKVTINIMRMLDATKYDINLVLVSKIGEYINLVPPYVTVHNLNSKKTLLSIYKLRKTIIKIKPDIIYSSLIRANIVMYLTQLTLLNKPIMILRSPNSPKLLLKNKQIGCVTQFFLRKAYQQANMVLAQTPEMKFELEKYYKLCSDKVKVLLNPLDTSLIDEKVHNTSNPFDDNYINVVAAGRLTSQKGFDTLIRAFDFVVQDNTDFRLYIIGSDHGEGKRLLRLIDDLNLTQNIFLLGFQENPYKFFYYSDLFVLSSRWEGLPNAVLENLYLNKPVIATRCIPFMDTLIKNYENGILVEVDNITELSKAILEYKKIKQNKDKIAIDPMIFPLEYIFNL